MVLFRDVDELYCSIMWGVGLIAYSLDVTIKCILCVAMGDVSFCCACIIAIIASL